VVNDDRFTVSEAKLIETVTLTSKLMQATLLRGIARLMRDGARITPELLDQAADNIEREALEESRR
jgi:hypothetical protein